MRLPRKLRINGITWRVIYRKRLRHPDSKDAVDGFSHDDTNTIGVRIMSSRVQMRSVLWHECLHALDPCREEESIGRIADGTFAIIMDNRLFREFGPTKPN